MPVLEDTSSDSDGEWDEAEAAVQAQLAGDRLEEEDDDEEYDEEYDDFPDRDEPQRASRATVSRSRSPSPRAPSLLSSTSAEYDDDTSVLETSVSSAEHVGGGGGGGGGGGLRLQPAADSVPLDFTSDDDAESRRTVDTADVSDYDDSVLFDSDEEEGDEEEGDDGEALIQYIGVVNRKELKISEAVEKIKAQIFGPGSDGSLQAAPATSGSPRQMWTAEDEEELLEAIEEAGEEAAESSGEISFAMLAQRLERKEEDVRFKLMSSKGHRAMCYARAFLGMEQLVTFYKPVPRNPNDDVPEIDLRQGGFREGIEIHDDNNHVLAAYLLGNEVGRLSTVKGQKPLLHRALRVDVQQVVDELHVRQEVTDRIVTGWNVLREHAERENMRDPESDQNVAIDVIERGELLFSLDATACRNQDTESEDCSCIHHDVLGVGMVRVKVLRYYRVSPVEGRPARPVARGRFIPWMDVDTEHDTLRLELLELWELETTTGLIDRAVDSLERYPLLDTDHLDEELERCMRPDPPEPDKRRDDLIALIVELEIVKTPLWASMYDDDGSRLLELLPQHGDVQPAKPIGFGSRSGASSSRRTSHMNSSGVGSAAPHSMHVEPEHTQRVDQSVSQRRAVKSMVQHTRQRQRRNATSKRVHAAAAAPEHTSRVHSVHGGGVSSSSVRRAPGDGSMMDKSLYQFLQQNDLVGCEQKLQR
jgi:hypothetical protein